MLVLWLDGRSRSRRLRYLPEEEAARAADQDPHRPGRGCVRTRSGSDGGADPHVRQRPRGQGPAGHPAHDCRQCRHRDRSGLRRGRALGAGTSAARGGTRLFRVAVRTRFQRRPHPRRRPGDRGGERPCIHQRAGHRLRIGPVLARDQRGAEAARARTHARGPAGSGGTRSGLSAAAARPSGEAWPDPLAGRDLRRCEAGEGKEAVGPDDGQGLPLHRRRRRKVQLPDGPGARDPGEHRRHQGRRRLVAGRHRRSRPGIRTEGAALRRRRLRRRAGGTCCQPPGRDRAREGRAHHAGRGQAACGGSRPGQGGAVGHRRGAGVGPCRKTASRFAARGRRPGGPRPAGHRARAGRGRHGDDRAAGGARPGVRRTVRRAPQDHPRPRLPRDAPGPCRPRRTRSTPTS